MAPEGIQNETSEIDVRDLNMFETDRAVQSLYLALSQLNLIA